MAYFSDLETAALRAYYLQVLIDYLSESTSAERIHIIGYSAGTRVVINALTQIAMHEQGLLDNPDPSAPRNRIGQVMLVGSDYDRGLFAAALAVGLLDITESVTIYQSRVDKALALSNWVFDRERIGEMLDKEMLPEVRELLRGGQLSVIDVSDAENASARNGHAYFRQSPWVSSDILVSLSQGLSPAERGLVQEPDLPIWTFPPDYLTRLRATLAQRHPELAASWQR